MNNQSQKLADLLQLSHDLGDPRHSMAILAEGNASVRLGPESFLVKASGTNMATLRKEGIVQCRAGGLLKLLNETTPTDGGVEHGLMESRSDPRAKKPSVESLFHAWLLTLPGIEFVGHTHPVAVNSILCSPRAKEFARRRIFPDEIVCCDVESVLVPYTDPGLRLAQVIRERTGAFLKKHGRPPRVILLENHGVITLGPTADAVLAAMLMAEKTARIWLGAASLGGPKFLPARQTSRISNRPDEHLRRKILRM